jgi:hypothetical protein
LLQIPPPLPTRRTKPRQTTQRLHEGEKRTCRTYTFNYTTQPIPDSVIKKHASPHARRSTRVVVFWKHPHNKRLSPHHHADTSRCT